MKRALVGLFLMVAILVAVPVLAVELLPVIAAEDQIQCGKYLVKTADGDWRVKVKGDNGDYPLVLKSGDLWLEIVLGQKQTQLAWDGAVHRFWPTAEETADACVAAIPKYEKKK